MPSLCPNCCYHPCVTVSLVAPWCQSDLQFCRTVRKNPAWMDSPSLQIQPVLANDCENGLDAHGDSCHACGCDPATCTRWDTYLVQSGPQGTFKVAETVGSNCQVQMSPAKALCCHPSNFSDSLYRDWGAWYYGYTMRLNQFVNFSNPEFISESTVCDCCNNR